MSPKRKLSLEEVQHRRQELELEKADNRQELKRLKAEESRESRRESCPFTKFQQEVALTLYLLGGWRVEPAIDYLDRIDCSRGDDDDEANWRKVEKWAAEKPQEVIDVMGDKLLAPNPKVYKAAARHFAQWQTKKWVEHQNVAYGPVSYTHLTLPTKRIV